MNEKKIQLITHFDDCLSQYFSLRKQDSVDFSPVSYPELSSLQQQLLKHFGTESVISIDTLLATCSLSYADLLQELTILELKHYIQSL